MASQMPSRICRGDKVRIKSDQARKYGFYPEDIFVVASIDKIGGSPRLYVNQESKPERGLDLLWGRDCELAWGKASLERKKALGYV